MTCVSSGFPHSALGGEEKAPLEKSYYYDVHTLQYDVFPCQVQTIQERQKRIAKSVPCQRFGNRKKRPVPSGLGNPGASHWVQSGAVILIK